MLSDRHVIHSGVDGTLRQSICHAAAWPDHAKNVRAYGPNASARDIALGTTSAKMGDEAMPFTTALERETVGRRA